MRARTVLEGVTDKAKERMFHIAEPFKKFEERYRSSDQGNNKIIYTGFDKYKNPVKIIKNPSNLKFVQDGARGITTKTDLYVLAIGNLIHSDILEILGKLGELKYYATWWQDSPLLSGYVSLQRVDDTNIFAVGESQGDILKPRYYQERFRTFQEFDDFLDNIREIFPEYKFIARSIWHLEDREYKE